MDRIFSETKQSIVLSPPPPPPYFLYTPPPPPPSDFTLNDKVSPSVLFIIVILAIIFFISGLLHLLVRFLLRPPNRDANDLLDNVTAFQGQLQQLFHLHDSGVDQSFIDTLPVFNYKAIIGVKNPFDCAVCLCEFEQEDNLRLLPKCSHAFHMECIDTWLLSHSTCPICRSSLLADFSQNNHCFPPIVLVLESASESFRENVSETDGVSGTSNSLERANSHLGFHCRDEFGSTRLELSREIEAKDDENEKVKVGLEEKVVAVKLGKFRNVDGGGGGEGSSHDNGIDARRCFSMGSFAYVMDENSLLQVPIKTPMKKQSSKKPSLPLTPGHKPAMSECGFDSRNGFEPFKSVDIHGIGSSGSFSNGKVNGTAIGRSTRESFSVSKTWLRAKREKPNLTAAESSRRAFSFRFPVHRNVVAGDELKAKNGGGGGGGTRWTISEIDFGRWDNGGGGGGGTRRTISEIDIGRWENGGGSGELVYCDVEETHSCSNSLDSQANANPPSFARRSMLWLVGRPKKVVHSSFSSHV